MRSRVTGSGGVQAYKGMLCNVTFNFYMMKIHDWYGVRCCVCLMPWRNRLKLFAP